MHKRLLSVIASPTTRETFSSCSVTSACGLPEARAALTFISSRALVTLGQQPCSQQFCVIPAQTATQGLWTTSKCIDKQSFTTFAAGWQQTTDTNTGLNPLMQTPGPAIQLPGPRADTAAPLTAQAVLRKTKISPKKLNEFAKLVRRLHIDDALVQCQVAPNKAAKLCYKLLLSAKDNAVKDKGLDANKLHIDRAFVGKGQHFKRISMHARGRSATRLKYHSHLTIILAEGRSKPVIQYRPPNAQWHSNRRAALSS